MKNWIYLKREYRGFDDIKAAALAAVLNKSSEHFNVVHTNIISIYLNRLKNVTIGYPSKSEGDTIISLELSDNAPFKILCDRISVLLNLQEMQEYEPYLGFVRSENEVDRQLSKLNNIVAFCYFLNERETLIVPQLEKVIESSVACNFKAVSCGSRNEQLLKGSYDYRELIQIDELIKNRDRIKAIVTSLPLVKEIGCLLHIPVIYLYTYAVIVYFDGNIVVESTNSGCSQTILHIINSIINHVPLQSTNNSTNSFIDKKFEVPYGFDELILPYYKHYSSYINFLFLPPYADDSINTRTSLQSRVKGQTYMPSSRKEYEYHIKLIKEHKLSFVVLWQDRFNLISKEMIDYYSQLGTKGFIIANDKNAKRIKDYNPNLLVISSIVQRLNENITKKDFRYYDFVVMFYPFNRSLNVIKKLTNIKEKIVIMPNSFCHTDCQGIQHWFNDKSNFDSEKSCPAFLDDKKSTFIRPDHLYLFDDYVGGYKLQGREWKTDYVVTICEAYFNRKTLDYLIPSEKIRDTLQLMMSQMSLDDYYNLKTPEIESVV